MAEQIGFSPECIDEVRLHHSVKEFSVTPKYCDSVL